MKNHEELHQEPGELPKFKLSAREIDDWIDNARFVTPVGGEIVFESAETFDYPFEPSSPEDTRLLHIALDEVLAYHRTHSEIIDVFRETLLDKLLESGDNVDLDEIIEKATEAARNEKARKKPDSDDQFPE
ncbi:hypothetical protein [Acidithrix ferrooxidans]|uniref:Uncharacterized protein n=1 Tax=Acidithrix ferrooxidans TaxID=1280514 RepID=A0A0D8HJK8_9ACTN|nr:hypothetical protein [Acidithrix ferrooxidans]KJF18049.1 hypothetical protein AXFE_11480 [Acidithrix ferrooxidans]